MHVMLLCCLVSIDHGPPPALPRPVQTSAVIYAPYASFLDLPRGSFQKQIWFRRAAPPAVVRNANSLRIWREAEPWSTIDAVGQSQVYICNCWLDPGDLAGSEDIGIPRWEWTNDPTGKMASPCLKAK